MPEPTQAQVFHFDLYGKREEKYAFLNENRLQTIDWTKLEPGKPNFFFMANSMNQDNQYLNWIKVSEIFSFSNTGIQTGKDALVIDHDKTTLIERIKEVLNSIEEDKIRRKYDLRDTSGWTLASFKEARFNDEKIQVCDYRPFDTRYIFFDNQGLKRDRISLNKHILSKNNISLSLKRQSKFDFSYSFVHQNICESCLFESAYANNSEFPLYLYPDSDQPALNMAEHDHPGAARLPSLPGGELKVQLSGAELLAVTRVPNLNMEIVNAIANKLGLTFVPEKQQNQSTPPFQGGVSAAGGRGGFNTTTFSPIDILDYIYAVLHSPTYREKYKEFLKIDFPRVPYPNDAATFWQLVNLGAQIRQIHLLESPTVEKFITQYPIDGDNIVTKPRFITSPPLEGLGQVGKVYINDTQYFNNVPQVAWEFYIGGYQPAQKWLKDRKDRKLEFDDILHYQKIIVALTETNRLMKEIDQVAFE